MENLKQKKILLIICGGIAAYKSLDVIRILKKNSSKVKTILTKNAQNFITPLSVTSLSQEKVYTDLFNSDNVVMEKDSDHGLSELSVNKNLKFSLGNSISAIPEETDTESQEINKEPVTESP